MLQLAHQRKPRDGFSEMRIDQSLQLHKKQGKYRVLVTQSTRLLLKWAKKEPQISATVYLHTLDKSL